MFKSVSEEDQNQITLDEIKDNIINTGWLIKQGSKQKTWKKRYFVLTESFLYYFKDSNLKSKSAGSIFLLGDAVYYNATRADLECLKTPSLKFETPTRTLFAYAHDVKDIEEWIELFNQTTKTNWDKTKNYIDDEEEEEEGRKSEVDEEEINKLKSDVEFSKKKLDDYLYGSYGVNDVNNLGDGKIEKDEEFDELILNTKRAIKRFSGALEIFENSLREESKLNLANHEYVKSRSSFVEILERKKSTVGLDNKI
eukprot:gene7675-12141_t